MTCSERRWKCRRDSKGRKLAGSRIELSPLLISELYYIIEYVNINGGYMKSDDAKTETLQFKVTDSERKLIEKCAEDEGTTVSKYVRGAVLMSLVMDGKAEAIKIVAREVGEKTFAMVRQKLTRPTSEGR